MSTDTLHGESARDTKNTPFTVDGESYETRQREWTPNEIIRQFAEKDPATFYLVEIHGQQQVSYKDKGGEPIKINPHDRFQTISIGPMPVSDSNTEIIGIQAFMSGLIDLGYHPRQTENHPTFVIIDYTVEVGKHTGQRFTLGFQVPEDFPLTPPSGPHVSPGFHPINPNAEHPYRAHESPLATAEGGSWQYWSRPHPAWGKRTVANYMSHIAQLWATQ